LQLLSLIWGILAICGMFIGLIPFLGWLNWGNIPFAIVGLIISIIATTSARGNRSMGITGIALCAIAIIFGAIRLKMGCGFI
jgi:hypothetical protein